VKALGGEEVKLPKGMEILVQAGQPVGFVNDHDAKLSVISFPAGGRVRYAAGQPWTSRPESFVIGTPGERLRGMTLDGKPAILRVGDLEVRAEVGGLDLPGEAGRLNSGNVKYPADLTYTLPANCKQLVPGSSWGTFTIACTIPIALFVGLYMYRLRPGKVVEASLIGGVLVLAATVAGNWVPGSPLEPYFSLSRDGTIVALVVYGFVAAVLPVWLLLGPRDYLSSFLKIGTVVLLVLSVIVANPPLNAPRLNEVFINGGPTFQGNIFPFVFICIMCGAVSGFHSLVSSGTTPKMIDKESQVRPIGYGAMLIEGLVGVTALIAAAALPCDLYYDINVAIDQAPRFQSQIQEVNAKYGRDPLHEVGVDHLSHLDLGKVEEKVGGESLRGRTGGAVTLAVGMSVVFEDAFRMFGVTGEWLLKYWYHFAIMFEALFILTTIDAGTRIGRFLLQETLGRVYAPFARPDWLPGAVLASAVITVGWGWLIRTGSITTIWPMFGIANQLLAVLALSLVTTWLVNTGRGRFAPITLVPMLWVTSTTVSAGAIMVRDVFPLMIEKGRKAVEAGDPAGNAQVTAGYLNIALSLFVMATVGAVVLTAAARWVAVWTGRVPTRPA
jgi:carbon starvation protein